MQLADALKNSVVMVQFKKADGSVRDMMCTLLEHHIKIKTVSRNTMPRSVITVWDIEKEDWRSFKPDSVIKFEVVKNDK